MLLDFCSNLIDIVEFADGWNQTYTVDENENEFDLTVAMEAV